MRMHSALTVAVFAASVLLAGAGAAVASDDGAAASEDANSFSSPMAFEEFGKQGAYHHAGEWADGFAR